MEWGSREAGSGTLGRGFKALRDVGLGFRPGRPVACFSTKLDEEALPDEQMEMPPGF